LGQFVIIGLCEGERERERELKTRVSVKCNLKWNFIYSSS